MTRVRVIGGQARGRILRSPAGQATRPTSDRVREAVFSMVSSMEEIEGASVLDLFAGSGALGIESLSRGAASAVLVDSSAQAVKAIRENLGVLGARAEAATVVRADAARYLQNAPRIDVVFADPPYRYDGWDELLRLLSGVAGLLVVETGSGWEPGSAWETVKVKRYGGTVVTVARPATRANVVRAEEGES